MQCWFPPQKPPHTSPSIRVTAGNQTMTETDNLNASRRMMCRPGRVMRGWIVILLLHASACADAPHPLTDDLPVTELYVGVGSTFSTACGGMDEGPGEVGVEWMRNGTVLTPGGFLTLQNVSLESGGIYTCHAANGTMLQRLHLQPGYPPSTPEVRCWSPNYPHSVICSWDEQPEPTLPTSYIATYSLQHSREVLPCHSVPDANRRCVMQGMKLFSIDHYIFNVTAINPLGSSTRLLLFTLEDIVKPDPPVNVRVVPGFTKQLIVEWAPPPTWTNLPYFPLKYKVRFYRNSKASARILGPYESLKMTLKGLLPGSTYYIQISAQELLDVGQSSDWTTPITATVA
ncbi:interleukin-27 subunit beta isoform X1 [Paramormyrops kingsleyae]|uniref:interleukin-27 subunit beta isoform X1 n=1 Tax=Paramormyrops kingsleyae TaxID=1676925 RepID=UPI003B976517